MKRFKTLLLSITILLAFVISLVLFFDHYYEKERKETIVTQQLFLLLNSYDSLYEDHNNGELNLAQLEDVKNRLTHIKKYSKAIDRHVSYPILQQIAAKFLETISTIEENHDSQTLFQEESIAQFQGLLRKVAELQRIITSNYFLGDDNDRVRANVNLQNFEEVQKFEHQVGDYIYAISLTES